jgi:hypothetical protein
MSYLVTSPCVLAKDSEGRIHYHYEGSTINWLSKEQAKHFLDENLVEKVSDDESVDEHHTDEGRPKKVAPKPVLVDWLADRGYDRDELQAQSKDDLWELIDAQV